MATTFSQCGEDIIIDHIFRHVIEKPSPGFYVDVGAFHPTTYSNTALLYEKGWHGINIDADAGAIELFAAERPNDVSICIGVSKERASRDFFIFASGAASTCDIETRDTWLGLGWQQVATRRIETAPLSEILAPHLREVDHIDYMNIDIEGLDREALATFDFAKWRPSVLTIEVHGFDIMHAADHPIVRMLVELGYRLFSYAIVTAIFVRA